MPNSLKVSITLFGAPPAADDESTTATGACTVAGCQDGGADTNRKFLRLGNEDSAAFESGCKLDTEVDSMVSESHPSGRPSASDDNVDFGTGIVTAASLWLAGDTHKPTEESPVNEKVGAESLKAPAAPELQGSAAAAWLSAAIGVTDAADPVTTNTEASTEVALTDELIHGEDPWELDDFADGIPNLPAEFDYDAVPELADGEDGLGAGYTSIEEQVEALRKQAEAWQEDDWPPEASPCFPSDPSIITAVGGGTAMQTEARSVAQTHDESEENGNSGKILLMLLKGTRPPSQPSGAAGALPASLRDDRWEPLLRPFCDRSDPKHFVGAEQFGPGQGIVVAGSGSQPVVLKDLTSEGLLVMFKPSGWATCSTPQWEGIEGNLIRFVWSRHQHPMAAPCHRLDRGTSGAVVVATNRVALRHIAIQITSRTLVKQYFGLCHGRIEPPQGALSVPLALSSTDKPLGACAAEGRPAVTRYRVLGYFSRAAHIPSGNGPGIYSLVQLQIDHGRQHQIRLHMASIGHPLVYDQKYHSSALREDSRVCSRLWLHAAYVQCTLPPGGAETLQVACRLPVQLKDSLTRSLKRERNIEDDLPDEATALCDCLLDAEPANASGDSSIEARLAARKRDEFLKSFKFSRTEREEVIRILSSLPTPEERSSALQRFRVLGDRTPDFIVTRFEKYVEGLLKQKHQGSGCADGEEDSAPSAKKTPTSSNGLPEDGYGPVSMHTESVTCDVCGGQEKVQLVEFPRLKIRLSCRMCAEPLAEPLARLLGCAASAQAGGATQHASSSSMPHSMSLVSQHGNRLAVPPPPPPPPPIAMNGWHSQVPGRPMPMRQAAWQASASHPPVPPPPADDQDHLEEKLSAELIAFLQARGNQVNGPVVASEFASRYNAWLRKDAKRNDGSLRKWIGDQPGVSVEHCGGNRWKVHLDNYEYEKARRRRAR